MVQNNIFIDANFNQIICLHMMFIMIANNLDIFVVIQRQYEYQ